MGVVAESSSCMNDGNNGLTALMLIAAPVIFAEKEVDLNGKTPWVGLYRTIWFQFLVPESGGFVCPVLPSDAQTQQHSILCTQQHSILQPGTRAGESS